MVGFQIKATASVCEPLFSRRIRRRRVRSLFIGNIIKIACILALTLMVYVLLFHNSKNSLKKELKVFPNLRLSKSKTIKILKKYHSAVFISTFQRHNALSKNFLKQLVPFPRNSKKIHFNEIIYKNLSFLHTNRIRRANKRFYMDRREAPFDGKEDYTESWFNEIEENKLLQVDGDYFNDKNKHFQNVVRKSEFINGFRLNISDGMKRSEVFQIVKEYCKGLSTNMTLLFKNASILKDSEEKETRESCKNEMNGEVPALWTILYIFIVLCLFIGLAIICDDFFVPSLEAITEKLNLSEDVAGATFMAAGSSAPELFTSVAGIGTGSDVGVGTIVGSAVFNLLVIIALTSALSGRVLQIDWRPLVRDSMFYGFSITVFTLFSLDAYFQWWESFLLLVLYFLYIVTMKFNPLIMNWMAKASCCFFLEVKDGRVSPSVKQGENQSSNHVGSTNKFQEVVGSHSLVDTTATHRNVLRKSMSLQTEGYECGTNSIACCCTCCCCQRRKRALLRKTVDALQPSQKTLIKETSVKTLAPSSSNNPFDDDDEDSVLCSKCSRTQCWERKYDEEPTQRRALQSIPPQSFKQESCGNGIYDSDINLELKLKKSCEEEITDATSITLQVAPPPPCNILSPEQVATVCPQCGMAFTRQLFLEENFIIHQAVESPDSKSYLQSSDARLAIKDLPTMKQNEISEETVVYKEVPLDFDLKDGAPNETRNVETNASKENTSTADIRSSISSDGERPGEQFLSVFPCLPPIKCSTPSKPDSSNCEPSVKYIVEWLICTLSFPWLCAFTWSVPDCSKQETKKWFMLSFGMSIAWIAGISYSMVEIVEKVGCLLNIDTYTMGLVVIAIGTSVPDAISSVLVAKAGYGDMAVSNAIGSNVFDINLGLGLPFFISNIISGEPFHLLTPLQSCLFENLPLPVKMVPHVKFGLILLIILFLCTVVFFFVRFKLTRSVGILFFITYIVFMVYSFVQEKSCYGFFC